MSIYPTITKQGKINFDELTEKQKKQRATETKNRNLKQTHDIKVAENLSPITKKLDNINETTENLGEVVEKSEVEDGNTQTLAIQNIIGTQSSRVTSAFMILFYDSEKGKKNSSIVEKDNGDVFWNNILLRPLGENRIIIKNVEYDITPEIQRKFTNINLTTKSLDNDEKETVFDILNIVGFYDMRHTKGVKSARMKDSLKYLPKVIQRTRNPLLSLPSIEDRNFLRRNI